MIKTSVIRFLKSPIKAGVLLVFWVCVSYFLFTTKIYWNEVNRPIDLMMEILPYIFQIDQVTDERGEKLVFDKVSSVSGVLCSGSGYDLYTAVCGYDVSSAGYHVESDRADLSDHVGVVDGALCRACHGAGGRAVRLI